jgi:5'-phosphate synthase pdxT subunit
MKPRAVVGVLAFQGDYAKHQQAFSRLHCDVCFVKSPVQLKKVDCLVMPGGESSVIDRFIRSEEMTEPLKEFAKSKLIWGTCAGMILLAAEIRNDKELSPLSLINISVDRNGYGRQLDSFIDEGEFSANGSSGKLQMVFIRAPKIVRIGEEVSVLGTCRGEVTIVQQGKVLATAFHPELTASTRFQEYFLSLI